MSGSGRAGSGRGNNRRRPSRRRDNDEWQDGEYSRHSSHRSDTSRKADNSGGNENVRNGSSHERRNSGRPGAAEGRSRGREYSDRFREGGASSGAEENRRSVSSGRSNENFRGERVPFFDRPKWTPPKQNTEPLPVPNCPCCGKPIRDIASAMSDRDTGIPVHFECVAARIAGSERLEKGDSVTYIGGGRFGIVNFGRSETSSSSGTYSGNRGFRIKKIIEWENKDNRAEWRAFVSDHYSVT